VLTCFQNKTLRRQSADVRQRCMNAKQSVKQVQQHLEQQSRNKALKQSNLISFVSSVCVSASSVDVV